MSLSDNWIAELDQMKAGLRDLGGVLATYRDHLVEAGFDSGDAD